MPVESKKCIVHQGETLELPFDWQDEDGTLFLLATYTDIRILFFPQGVTTPIDFTGVGADVSPNIFFELTPAQTLSLAPGIYEVILKLTSAGGKVYMIPDTGRFIIEIKEVT